MKKIIIMMACFAGLLSLSGCCNDEATTDSGLAIVKSEVKFGCNPSDGYIQFTSPSAVKATSSEDWCTATVSGDKVLVEVTGNTEHEGRNALVTLSDGNSSISVPVNQTGRIFRVSSEDMYTVSGKAPEDISINVKATSDVVATSSVRWIHTDVADDAVVISFDQNTGAPRAGKVYINDGIDENEISIIQFSKNDGIDGAYGAYYYSSGWKAYSAQLEMNEDKTGYDLSLLGFSIPLVYSSDGDYLVMKNMNSIGSYSGIPCYNLNVFADTQYLYYNFVESDAYDMYFDVEIDEDATVTLEMSEASPASAYGLSPYALFLGYVYGTQTGILARLPYFTLESLPSSDEEDE
jgi:hypothetical protein